MKFKSLGIILSSAVATTFVAPLSACKSNPKEELSFNLDQYEYQYKIGDKLTFNVSTKAVGDFTITNIKLVNTKTGRNIASLTDKPIKMIDSKCSIVFEDIKGINPNDVVDAYLSFNVEGVDYKIDGIKITNKLIFNVTDHNYVLPSNKTIKIQINANQDFTYSLEDIKLVDENDETKVYSTDSDVSFEGKSIDLTFENIEDVKLDSIVDVCLIFKANGVYQRIDELHIDNTVQFVASESRFVLSNTKSLKMKITATKEYPYELTDIKLVDQEDKTKVYSSIASVLSFVGNSIDITFDSVEDIAPGHDADVKLLFKANGSEQEIGGLNVKNIMEFNVKQQNFVLSEDNSLNILLEANQRYGYTLTDIKLVDKKDTSIVYAKIDKEISFIGNSIDLIFEKIKTIKPGFEVNAYLSFVANDIEQKITNLKVANNHVFVQKKDTEYTTHCAVKVGKYARFLKFKLDDEYQLDNLDVSIEQYSSDVTVLVKKPSVTISEKDYENNTFSIDVNAVNVINCGSIYLTLKFNTTDNSSCVFNRILTVNYCEADEDIIEGVKTINDPILVTTTEETTTKEIVFENFELEGSITYLKVASADWEDGSPRSCLIDKDNIKLIKTSTNDTKTIFNISIPVIHTGDDDRLNFSLTFVDGSNPGWSEKIEGFSCVIIEDTEEFKWNRFIDSDINYKIDTESNWEYLTNHVNNNNLQSEQIKKAIADSKIASSGKFSWDDDYYAYVKMSCSGDLLYKVSLVDLDKDVVRVDDKTTTTAIMTWEFKNLLSSENGQPLTTYWNEIRGETNENYFKSDINEILSAEQTDLSWEYNDGKTKEIKGSFLSMMPKVLSDNVVEVQRTAICGQPGEWGLDTTHSTKIFLPTVSNYYSKNAIENSEAWKNSFFEYEGVGQYKFYEARNSMIHTDYTTDLLKTKSLDGQIVDRWLATPNATNGSKWTNASTYVNSNGIIRSLHWIYDRYPVAPCFCLGITK